MNTKTFMKEKAAGANLSSADKEETELAHVVNTDMDVFAHANTHTSKGSNAIKIPGITGQAEQIGVRDLAAPVIRYWVHTDISVEQTCPCCRFNSI
jgi:hypothetical protein